MSSTDVPTSAAVIYRPPRDSMARPCAREDRLTLRRVVVTDDDRFPSTEGETRDGRFVGHAPRQAEHVGDRLGLRRVVPKPCATERRA